MARYKLTLEYDGTSYSGWQTQKNARSVQGTLIRAAQEIFGQAVDIQARGRTDAGVHALGQVAHLETARTLPLQKILYGLNDHPPVEYQCAQGRKCPRPFSCPSSGGRQNLYLPDFKVPDGLRKRYVWWVRDSLNVEKMQAAGFLFQGFHDFASFADRRFDKEASQTLVMINGAEVLSFQNRSSSGSPDLIFSGKWSAGSQAFWWKWEEEISHCRMWKRCCSSFSDVPAKWTAPPSGLFLMQVLYEGDREEPVRLPFILTP